MMDASKQVNDLGLTIPISVAVRLEFPPASAPEPGPRREGGSRRTLDRARERRLGDGGMEQVLKPGAPTGWKRA
jgi:hypothetical protein